AGRGVQALSASWDGTVRLWDLTAGKELHTFTGHTGRVWAVAVSRDGLRAASAGDDTGIRLWDLRDNKEVHRFTSGAAKALAFTPDGSQLVSAGADRKIHVWDVTNRKSLREIAGHADRIESLALSSDGKYAVTGSEDKT